MKETKPTSVKVNQLFSKEFGKVKVVSDGNNEGYVCLDDLCDILNLSKKQVKEKLEDHLYTVSPRNAKGPKYDMDFVDEFGVYMLYIMSVKKDAIRFQDWLHEEFFQHLYEQQNISMGFDKDTKPVLEVDAKLQTLRYMATAANVVKSGHFKKGKDIPELTQSHMIGWWHNLNDQSIFMLQFNCKTQCYLYENVRMNVYLRKMVDGRTGSIDMHISFLDLDDDNHEFFAIDTIMPCSVIMDGTILDFIMKDQFLDEDIMDPENLDLVLILNGTMSFHRSRRIEKKEQQGLIEFL